jgi:hypothetical protein
MSTCSRYAASEMRLQDGQRQGTAWLKLERRTEA